jgi:cytochrome c biogenesis protein CcdA
VTDPLAATVAAVARGDVARLPIVVLGGVLTSVGPCVAPRYIAVAALLEGRRPYLTIAIFVSGILVAYAALGFGVGILGTLARHASVVYCILAATLAGAGMKTLLQAPRCVHDRHGKNERSMPLSGAFSLGATSALVVSPCCTPVVAAVVGMTAFDANVLSRVTLLVAFALGHTLPLFLAVSGNAFAGRTLLALNDGCAPTVVSGTLMIALGIFYGLLV